VERKKVMQESRNYFQVLEKQTTTATEEKDSIMPDARGEEIPEPTYIEEK
jgi:hypothetical protein